MASNPAQQTSTNLQQALAALIAPEWKFTESLPQLTKETFDIWESNLKNVLKEHNMSKLLEENFSLDTYSGSDKTTLEKASASASRMISASFHPTVACMVPAAILDETPNKIMQKLQSLIRKENSLAHSILKSEAKALTLSDDMSIQDYVDKHLQLRAKMTAAKYPDIENELTTVKLMVQGLSNHPLFSNFVTGWYCYGLPPSIDELHERLQNTAIHCEQQDPVRNLYTHPTAPLQAHRTRQPSPYNRGRRHYTGDNYRGNRYNRGGRGRYGQHTPTNLNLRKDIAHLAKLVEGIAEAKVSSPNRRYRRTTKASATNTDTLNDSNSIDDRVIGELTAHIQQDPSEESMYSIDSACHPSHVNHPIPNMQPRSPPIPTITATAHTSHATHKGTLKLKTNTGSNIEVPTVVNKDIRNNLLSVHSLAKKYGHVLFSPWHCYILHTIHPHPYILGTATWRNGQYELDKCRLPENSVPKGASPALTARTIPTSTHKKRKQQTTPNARPTNTKPATHKSRSQPTIDPVNNISDKRHTLIQLPRERETWPSRQPKTDAFYKWHLILNHLHPKTIQQMAINNLLPLPRILKQTPPPISCSGCADGKARPKPFKPASRKYALGVAIASDVCGPIAPVSTHGNRYFVSFLDQHSRYATLYFTSTRKDVLKFLQTTMLHIKNLHGNVPHLFFSDNAKEYTSKSARQFLNKLGITAKTSLPYCPQQNGIAERFNATVMQAARAALSHSKIPPAFWEDAVRDATFKYNLSLHSSTGSVPHNTWFQTKIRHLKLFAFGQKGLATVITDHSLRKKLDPRAYPARYMFGIDTNTAMVLDLRSGNYKAVRALDFKPYSAMTDPVKNPYMAFKCKLPHPDPNQITVETSPPASLKQARRYPDASSWELAHNAELDKLDHEKAIKWLPNTQIPKSTRLVPLLMTYRYKRTPTGTLLERKARCTLRGDLMIPNLHYNPQHTAAFMADKATVRLMLALAAALGLKLDHFDIKSAFVQEQYPFDKPVYVRQHPRFNGSFKHRGKAGLLIKNIYGGPSGGFYYLKGAEEFLLSIHFTQCEADPCIFIRVKSATCFIIITLNIDDFLIAASSESDIEWLYGELQRKYPSRVKRLGKPTQYLGWKMDYLTDGAIRISQPNYIATALADMQMSDANGRPAPHVDGSKYHSPEETDKLIPQMTQKYQSILGQLRYITDCTRPDITYYVNRLSMAAHKPTRRHWLILKNVLKYLKQTSNQGLIYRPLTTKNRAQDALVTYTDADFAGDVVDRKSTSGAVHLFNGTPVAWSSVKQSIVALSTCEAEYVAATAAVQITNWLRRLLAELRLPPTRPTPMLIDNQSAIAVATNTAPTRKRKCIDVRRHHLQHHQKKGTIAIKHVASVEMLADIFTKPLGPRLFVNMKNKLGVTYKDEY